jgi:hypothetical protein
VKSYAKLALYHSIWNSLGRGLGDSSSAPGQYGDTLADRQVEPFNERGLDFAGPPEGEHGRLELVKRSKQGTALDADQTAPATMFDTCTDRRCGVNCPYKRSARTSQQGFCRPVVTTQLPKWAVRAQKYYFRPSAHRW